VIEVARRLSIRMKPLLKMVPSDRAQNPSHPELHTFAERATQARCRRPLQNGTKPSRRNLKPGLTPAKPLNGLTPAKPLIGIRRAALPHPVAALPFIRPVG
jgi:hypothetical protein